MKQSYLAIISGVILVAILAISWCGRSPKPQYAGIPTPSPSPIVSATPTARASVAPTPTQTPATDFSKVAKQVGPAVILISVFDGSGQLLRTGTGFFISDDGRLVTNWHLIEGGAHGVAKTSDGRIYNVTGILAEAPPLDLVVLKAEVKKKIPFVVFSSAAQIQPGTRVAAIASPLARRQTVLFAGTVSASKSGESTEGLELSAKPPDEAMGAPVVNESGAVLGMVTAEREQGTAANVVRPRSAIDELTAKIQSDTKARWHAAETSPSPPAEKGEASTATRSMEKPRIVYNPKPAYPAYSYFRARGSGTFRITFSGSGQAKKVDVIKSTGNETLDNVTLEALQKWKSTPGREWTVTVPVTFERH